MSMIETGLTLRPVLPAAVQTQLGLRDPRFRPLSDVKTVLRDLGEFDIDAAQIRELCELGVLISFDVAVSLDAQRPMTRVLTESIQYFRATGGTKYHELDWGRIAKLVIPHSKPVLTGVEIRHTLLCDRGHVENLIHAGELKPLKKSQCGPGGSWTVSRESFEQFLYGRKQ